MALAVNQATGLTAGHLYSGLTTVSGSLLVYIAMTYNQASAFANTDVTDNASNSWTLVAQNNGGASQVGVAIYMQNNGTRGSGFNVDWDSAGTPDANTGFIEITGQDTTSAFDATTTGTSTDATSPFDVTAGGAISGDQIAIYAVTVSDGANTAFGQPAGYTNIHNNPDGSTGLSSACSYKLLETGTPTVGATKSGTINSTRVLFATFKAPGGGPPAATVIVPFRRRQQPMSRVR